jgi:glutathione synthase
MGYLTTTYLLDLLPRTVQVVNNPFWVRNSPEKLLVLQFPDLIPPTLISRNYNAIQKFRKKHGDIVIKPLYGNGGIGVFRISQNDSNLAALCEMFFNNSREPLIAQKFLMDVFEGDKRIVLFDGEPVGALNRRPPEGEIRSNMHVGGEIQTAQLTENEISICKKIEPTLRQKGFIFVGIDVIGNYLTEINVTSPTGIQEIEHFETVNLAEKIWLILEKKHALHKN